MGMRTSADVSRLTSKTNSTAKEDLESLPAANEHGDWEQVGLAAPEEVLIER